MSSNEITLMHGTCQCRSEKIHHEGLFSLSCLTNNEDVAWYYAECALDECENDCGEYVVLNIQVNKDNLKVDYNAFSEPLSYYRNKYTNCDREWAEMLEGGSIPSPESEFDYQTSLDVTNSVMCIEAIKSNVIAINNTGN